MKNLSLYIHIPFCSAKCPYCDFYSVKYNEEKVFIYTEKLCERLVALSSKYNRTVNTVYFGGGTPSVIGTENIVKILKVINNNFNLINPEITLEANPVSALTLDFIKLKKYGVNRVSMGMQSVNFTELDLLGRKHTLTDITSSIEKIRLSGIDNISLDVMVGVANQTISSLQNTLDFCISLNVSHISSYILKIEENTVYNKIKDTLNLPDEDSVCDLYLFMSKYLISKGYNQYEISNFSKIGYESKHNLKYWNCDEYLGVGPSAHSFVDGMRFYYPRNINGFYNNEIISDGSGGDVEEYVMMRLRLSNGLSFDDFKCRYGYDFPKIYINNANKPKFSSYVCVTDEKINLTVDGFLMSNYIISSILFDD